MMATPTSRAGACAPPPADAPAAAGAHAGADFAILGGGPIGLVCALLLARHGWTCTLVDARPVQALQRDRRLLALSRGTLNILDPLVGSGFAPLGAIGRIHVSSRGDLGAARLGAQDFGGEAVGATVWYADLVGALAAAVQAQPRIRVLRPRRAVDVQQHAQGVRVLLDDGAQLDAAIAVDAEGTPPSGAEATHFALLAELEVDCARGEAIERFTREGPLALLPLPSALPAGAAAHVADFGAPRPTRLSMIWCLPAAAARERLALPEEALCALLAQALGPRLGTPRKLSGRSIFPLVTHRREDVCEHRLVRLGNAAQSLHPVAGQGFNLGMRDCLVLVRCLVDAALEDAAADGAVDKPVDSRVDKAASAVDKSPLAVDKRVDKRVDKAVDKAVDSPVDKAVDSAVEKCAFSSQSRPVSVRALQRYRARRRLDRSLFPALTNALPPVFATRFAPVVAARAAVLLAVDLLPGARRAFTRLLMFGAAR